MKASILIGSGFTKYPMSGLNLTGNLLSLQNKANFRGKRWWWKRTSRVRFAFWLGSREEIASMETSAGLSTWDFKVLQQKHKTIRGDKHVRRLQWASKTWDIQAGFAAGSMATAFE